MSLAAIVVIFLTAFWWIYHCCYLLESLWRINWSHEILSILICSSYSHFFLQRGDQETWAKMHTTLFVCVFSLFMNMWFLFKQLLIILLLLYSPYLSQPKVLCLHCCCVCECINGVNRWIREGKWEKRSDTTECIPWKKRDEFTWVTFAKNGVVIVS